MYAFLLSDLLRSQSSHSSLLFTGIERGSTNRIGATCNELVVLNFLVELKSNSA